GSSRFPWPDPPRVPPFRRYLFAPRGDSPLGILPSTVEVSMSVRWVAGIAPLALALSALADEGPRDPSLQLARERGMQLAREGRCDAALPDLATARAAAPDDVALLELSGLCELRLHRYTDAATTLESALRIAPDRADLSLALAMARFHAGDLDGAE